MSTSGRTRRLSGHDAEELAAALDLDVDDVAICHACLSFVAFALDSGDEREVGRWIRRIAPELWAEGLERPVRLALERAGKRGVASTADAIASVARLGPRSPVVHAIVRRLAVDLSARAKGDLLRMGFEPWPPPELGDEGRRSSV
jgi:hypothetical protein